MKNILSSLGLASVAMAALALATVPAVAESASTIKVPFSFAVNGKICPGGKYSVERNDLGTMVTLRSQDSSRTFSWVANGLAPAESGASLKFDMNGQNHVLRTVQFGELTTAQLDKKWNHENLTPQMTVGR
jgi:hypothetical protein